MSGEDKIVVTGGTGFLGSYILRQLIRQGHQDVHALRRKSSDNRLVKGFEDKVTWHIGDLDHVDELYHAIENAQRVIHTAGLVSFAPQDRDRLYQTNVQGTATVVNACLEHQVTKLIHISSSAALAKVKNGQPITEKTKWEDDKHISHYGRSKHLAEIEVWRGIAEGLDAVILHPTIILGAGIWESSSCKLFMQIHEGLKYYPPGGTGFVDVRDVARIAIDMAFGTEVNQAFIINESNYRFQEIFTQIAQGLGKNPPSRQAPRWVAKMIVASEFIKSNLTGKRPIITPDSIRNAYENFIYDNEKIRKIGYEFTPVSRTIRETTKLFREAAQNNYEPRLLSPRINTNSKSKT